MSSNTINGTSNISNISSIRQKFIDYYKSKNHTSIDSYPLIPKEDDTTLFVGSGMQPMLKYFLGEPHPTGSVRIVDFQKCFRAVDIDEIGDNRHTTFFEMLGNWSFGDYWKEEQLRWVFEFLVDEVGLDPKKLYVSVFVGDKKNNIPKDEKSVEIWQELFLEKGIKAKVVEIGRKEDGAKKGMQGGRIFYYGGKCTWWSRQGTPDDMPIGEPGGPSSEIHYKFDNEHKKEFGDKCHPECECGRFLEIANSVFMKYRKAGEATFKQLPEKNIDFGGGLERIAMALEGNSDIFLTDVFLGAINLIENETKIKYTDNKEPMRVIADHLRASVFLISEGVVADNKLQGYVLRRLIRRAAVKVYELIGNVEPMDLFVKISSYYIDYYGDLYFDVEEDKKKCKEVIINELEKFSESLKKGIKEVEKKDLSEVDAEFIFDLHQTYGFPFEISQEIYAKKGIKINREGFDKAVNEHKRLSRRKSAGLFKGGLGDKSKETIWYHTITHLLHQALRDVLGEHVEQKGSNITSERLRFDFSHPKPLTDAQIESVERIVNEKIKKGLKVISKTTSLQEAIDEGALGFFKDRYDDKEVFVYAIGDYSKEVCGGPHVKNTSEIKGKFKIIKEKSSGSGIRRIRAVVKS